MASIGGIGQTERTIKRVAILRPSNQFVVLGIVYNPKQQGRTGDESWAIRQLRFDILVELLEKRRHDLPRGPAEVGGLGANGIRTGKSDLLVEGHCSGRRTRIASVRARGG